MYLMKKKVRGIFLRVLLKEGAIRAARRVQNGLEG